MAHGSTESATVGKQSPRLSASCSGSVCCNLGDHFVYDEATAQAVRGFQQARGLMIDGIVGPQTYRAIDDARWRLGDRLLTYVVSHPLTGDDVASLQAKLQELGFAVARVDGIFGPDTQRAVTEFQRNMGLPSDGTCGPSTFKALQRIRPMATGGRPDALRASEAVRAAGPRLSGKTVVIDPGHGGFDYGWEGYGLRESDVAYDLASRIEGRLGRDRRTGLSVSRSGSRAGRAGPGCVRQRDGRESVRLAAHRWFDEPGCAGRRDVLLRR